MGYSQDPLCGWVGILTDKRVATYTLAGDLQACKICVARALADVCELSLGRALPSHLVHSARLIGLDIKVAVHLHAARLVGVEVRCD